LKRSAIPRRISALNALDRQTLDAFREAVRRYEKRPWVTGVSISIKERRGELDTSAGPVICIHVRKKISKSRVPKSMKIQSTLLGVPTDVIGADYRRRSGGGPAILPTFPLQPGVSIARANGTAATLGATVQDTSGARCLLCAAHTLREGGKFKKGDPIVHPAPSDAPGRFTVVARYQSVHLGMDAGVARLEPGIAATNVALLSNVEIGVPAFPMIGDILEKSGRSTGVTQAVVQGIGTFIGLFPALHLRPLSGSASTTPLSDLGDSGAIWYDVLTGAAKGLHSSGSGAAPNGDEYAIATIVASVVHDLKLTWPP
jgi:hypothetical protein